MNFVADPGPAFDGDAPEPEPVDGAPDPGAGAPPSAGVEPVVEWDPRVVETALTVQGNSLHQLAGRGASDWIYTETELRAIVPSLTRILNRYDQTRAAA